ncbi:MAG TPA: hypothetical protein VFY73_20480 [Ideonella sp.]|uniref:hypothetical protein n=1 Tax=Ideonella sp. TaxID=1929293 RepID=UPI002E35D54F|nr:hypothetical protein [Ideonella sp.]HEX5686412.1 hypothetical protein [Ideonella sp.]
MHRFLFLLAVTLAWLLPAAPARADLGRDIVNAYDFRDWTVKFRAEPEIIWPEPSFGDGVTSRWATGLQADWGPMQLNANILFERSFEPEEGKPIQMKYQWQLRHRWHPLMNFGLQGFGELGHWRHWNENSRLSHRAGPAFFGRVDLGQGGGPNKALLYQAAYLLGTVYSKRGGTFTLRVQYPF